MALRLHAHPLSSYCWKVLIALYEKGVGFELGMVDFGDPASAAAFRALWPIAKMPVLEDEGRTIVESSVIVEYLDRRHPHEPRLVPADPDSALEVRLLDRVFDNYVMSPMQKVVADRLRPAEARDPTGVAEARALLDTSYSWLETRLASRAFAAGAAFTLADCAAAPSLHYADKVHPFRARFPTLGDSLARLESRPSFARVLEEAAPFAHMFPQ
jgi:glutathione S-transferase